MVRIISSNTRYVGRYHVLDLMVLALSFVLYPAALLGTLAKDMEASLSGGL
jgi:hypothetical protein